MADSRVHGKGIFGLVLVLIGLALIAHNFNLLPYPIEEALINWPMLLMVVGVFILLTSRGNPAGWVVLLIGAVFWFPRIFDFALNFHEVFWPALFIGIGLLVVFRTYRNNPETERDLTDNDYLEDIAIFGGNERSVTSKMFKGGRITSIFGGSQINLQDADLAPGKNVLDVFTLFGGTTLIVPEDWEVKVEISSVLGGFDDKRAYSSLKNITNDKTLVIKGVVILGGGELKNR